MSQSKLEQLQHVKNNVVGYKSDELYVGNYGHSSFGVGMKSKH
jgi:hypothetical protein